MKKILTLTLVLSMLMTISTNVLAVEFVGASNWAIEELQMANDAGFITDKVAKDFSKNITREELCENLNNTVIPNTVERIDFMAFQDCLSFTEITIPNSVTSIDDQAFYRCENLQKLIFEGDVDYIGSSAFDECFNVTFVCKAGSNAEAYALEHEIPISYK
jgi:hypothetical protein